MAVATLIPLFRTPLMLFETQSLRSHALRFFIEFVQFIVDHSHSGFRLIGAELIQRFPDIELIRFCHAEPPLRDDYSNDCSSNGTLRSRRHYVERHAEDEVDEQE
jgi:hypothetical protein